MNDIPSNSRLSSSEWGKTTLLNYLSAQRIAYEEVLHQPVFNMAESSTLGLNLEGTRCKNLLVQDKKGTQRFLVVTAPDVSLDLGGLGRILGVGRLSMCPAEAMFSLLQVLPGALSPLALAVDVNPNKVRLLLDSSLRSVSRFLFHPLVNTSTISLLHEDFCRFIESTGHAVEYVSMPIRTNNFGS